MKTLLFIMALTINSLGMMQPPIGKVITETYGLWQKHVFVRKIRFGLKFSKQVRALMEAPKPIKKKPIGFHVKEKREVYKVKKNQKTKNLKP